MLTHDLKNNMDGTMKFCRFQSLHTISMVTVPLIVVGYEIDNLELMLSLLCFAVIPLTISENYNSEHHTIK